jgi:hypothetical protein
MADSTGANARKIAGESSQLLKMNQRHKKPIAPAYYSIRTSNRALAPGQKVTFGPRYGSYGKKMFHTVREGPSRFH